MAKKFGGDANITGIRKTTFMYDESYFDVDVFSVLHHGINVYDFFTDFCTVKTALYTSFRMGSIWTDGTWREAKGGGDAVDVQIMPETVAGIAKVGDNLKIDGEGRLSVDTADEVDGDNTRPITAAAVFATVGNIEVLLGTI